MATLTIKIAMDNAAFGECGVGVEVARILRRMADDVVDESEPQGMDGKRLYDGNGNHVGTVKVTGR